MESNTLQMYLVAVKFAALAAILCPLAVAVWRKYFVWRF